MELIATEYTSTSACAGAVQLVNCGLSNVTIEALRSRGILALFPIQKHVYDPASSGRDLIGRARTGSGKTLAFALPVVESLMAVSCCVDAWRALECKHTSQCKQFLYSVCSVHCLQLPLQLDPSDGLFSITLHLRCLFSHLFESPNVLSLSDCGAAHLLVVQCTCLCLALAQKGSGLIAWLVV